MVATRPVGVRPLLTEAEFLARRESVDRVMVVRQSADPDADRGARGRRARRALRHPVQPDVVRRQRLPRPGAERAARDGGGVHRHRQGPQRRALRRRGGLVAARPRGQAQAGRERAVVRLAGARAGHQGPGRPQGRPAHRHGHAARPLPRVRTRRLDVRDQPQAARERAQPPQVDLEEGLPRRGERDHPDRRGGRVRGGADPRRQAARGAVERDRDQARQRDRAEPALRRARPRDQGRPRHVQRGRHRSGDLRRRGMGHAAHVRLRRRPGPARPRHAVGRTTRTSSPRTASTSRSRRRWTARSGCRPAARS